MRRGRPRGISAEFDLAAALQVQVAYECQGRSLQVGGHGDALADHRDAAKNRCGAVGHLRERRPDLALRVEDRNGFARAVRHLLHDGRSAEHDEFFHVAIASDSVETAFDTTRVAQSVFVTHDWVGLITAGYPTSARAARSVLSAINADRPRARNPEFERLKRESGSCRLLRQVLAPMRGRVRRHVVQSMSARTESRYRTIHRRNHHTCGGMR